jgi:hypothetical protein
MSCCSSSEPPENPSPATASGTQVRANASSSLTARFAAPSLQQTSYTLQKAPSLRVGKENKAIYPQK